MISVLDMTTRSAKQNYSSLFLFFVFLNKWYQQMVHPIYIIYVHVQTQPLASQLGNIRGDYAIDLGRGVINGSDSPEGAEHELKMWFPVGVNNWAKTMDLHLYEPGRCNENFE